MSTIENLTTNEEGQEVEMKKSTKRSKSKQRKSKSRKTKTITYQQLLSDQQLEKKSLPDTKKSTATKKIHQTQTKPSSSAHTNNERQVKLNYFLCRKKGQLSHTSTSVHQNSTSKYAISEAEHRRSSLEKELKQKELILLSIKADRQLLNEKYSKLKYEAEQYKMRSRQAMYKQLRQFARLKRQQKAEIDPKYGYYRQAGWTVFVQGQAITKAKKRVDQLTAKIFQLEEKKRKSTGSKLNGEQQTHLLSSQIEYLKKQLTQYTEELKTTLTYVNTYKQRLRLSDKEQQCTMARMSWELIRNRYLPMELLGSGGFGQVYKAYDLDKNQHVAIKINCFEPTKSLQTKNQFIKHVERQVATLKELNHPNIVKLIDEVIIDGKIGFVLEYCTGPELNKYLAKHQHLEQHEAKGIVKQLSYALHYMYQQRHRVIHYDLKPANIMFHNGCVKILDFGLCKKMQTEDTRIDLTSQGVGTYWYLPPETFMDGAEISSKVDVWSLGVIFYELLYGKRPFGHGIGQNKIYQDGIILKAIKVEFPKDKKFKVSENAKQFIRECLKYNPEDRLDPQQVYEHQYLKN